MGSASGHFRPAWRRYGFAVISVLLTTAACLLLRSPGAGRIAFMLYIPATLTAAWYGGLGPGLAAMVAGAILGDYVFLESAGSAGHHALYENMVLATYVIATLISVALVEALRRARHAAEEASRAKDQFVAMLSHELRAPLTPVLMAVEAIEHDAELPPRMLDDMQMVHQYVELEARLIDDLLDIARIERNKLELRREYVDVHAVLNCICAASSNPGNKNVRLTLEADANEHHVHADPVRLQQVFGNLIRNAVKFTPEGGCIYVRSHNAPLSMPDERPSLVITVTDTGIGIDPSDLPKLFYPFEQADPSITRSYGGLGLGLTIAKRIVELHGGTIAAWSLGRDKGATFTVRLPTVAPLAEPSRAAAGLLPSTPLRLLLVEDDDATLRTMARVLQALGHQVSTASDVGTALQLSSGQRFDVVISDLGLPDGSGLDLMRHLKDRNVPGIALSGYGTEADRQRTRGAGFAEHLVKPISIQDLEQAIVRTASAHTGLPPDQLKP